jgi:hypothetical protein
VLLLDELGTDGAQLDVHKSSTGEVADRAPADDWISSSSSVSRSSFETLATTRE